jgi:hypothetical protein
MSDVSKNGNAVPASARFRHLDGSKKFAIFPMEWYPLMPSPTALGVFLALCAHIGRDGLCFPSRKTIARFACVHPNRVTEALRALEKLGAIQTESVSGGSSRYRIMPIPLPEVNETFSADPSPKSGETPPSPKSGETPHLNPVRPPHLNPVPISNQGSIHERERRARAKASEQAKADEQEAVRTDDEQACFANDLADAAFNATRGFTDEQRRANLARFKTMLTRRDARFGTTG